MKKQRRLIYIPVIHSREDMGKLGETLSSIAVREFGELSRWKARDFTSRMWDSIEGIINDLDLSFDRVRLYQDGLPVCGREEDIVKDLASGGSRNHQLLIRLMEKGALLTGTESPDLLVREYDIIRQLLEAPGSQDGGEGAARLNRQSAEILKERDRFIAGRVNSTLGPGETGILFLGMLHNLEKMLDDDIHVLYPLHKPSRA